MANTDAITRTALESMYAPLSVNVRRPTGADHDTYPSGSRENRQPAGGIERWGQVFSTTASVSIASRERLGD